MFIFTRTRIAKAGDEQAFVDDVKELAEVLSTTADFKVVPYQRVFGSPVNAATLYATVDSFAALGATRAKVEANPSCLSLIDHLGSLSEGPGDAHFLEIPAGLGPDYLELMTLDTGLAKLSRMNDAMGFAMKMAGIISEKAEQHTVFAADMYGTLGAMAWLTPADSYAQLDAQGKAIMGDEDYKKLMSESPEFFEATRFDRFLDRRLS